MTHDTKRARRLAPLPAAAIAVLLLAGCSTGHIGESWQCPLAEGGSCDSVAAADPAVPDAKAAGTTVLAEPLWRVRGGEPGPQGTASPCDAECAGLDPFGWLARLFTAQAPDGEGRSAGRSAPAATVTAVRPPDPVAGEAADAPVEPDAASLAQPGASRDEPERDGPAAALAGAAEGAGEDSDAGGLRTGEVVARIWIAPFVDADGVYREASHVRVVLEPAGWRLK